MLFLKRNGLFDVKNNYIKLADAKNEMRKIDINNELIETQFLLTDDCNLSCRYCYCSVSRDLPQNGLMDVETAKSAIDFLFHQDTPNVTITMFGGEPLLNKPAIDFIMEYSQSLAKEINKKIYYSITTNATLLDKKSINYIVDYNFGLMVSIDGPKKLHDNQCPMRNGEGSFDLAMKNIKELMKRRSVGIRATMIHPVPNLKELIDFFIDSGFYPLCICAASNRLDTPQVTDFTKNDYKELTEQIENLLPWILGYLAKGENPPYFPQETWYRAIKDNDIDANFRLFNCGAGYGKCAIDPTGAIFPCAKFAGMTNWKIGNIQNGVDPDKIKNMWLKFLECIEPTCGKCWAYPVCHGPCIWECAMQDGSFTFNDNICAYVKRNIELSAYLYFKNDV